jgi:hypothetical protein
MHGGAWKYMHNTLRISTLAGSFFRTSSSGEPDPPMTSILTSLGGDIAVGAALARMCARLQCSCVVDGHHAVCVWCEGQADAHTRTCTPSTDPGRRGVGACAWGVAPLSMQMHVQASMEDPVRAGAWLRMGAHACEGRKVVPCCGAVRGPIAVIFVTARAGRFSLGPDDHARASSRMFAGKITSRAPGVWPLEPECMSTRGRRALISSAGRDCSHARPRARDETRLILPHPPHTCTEAPSGAPHTGYMMHGCGDQAGGPPPS